MIRRYEIPDDNQRKTGNQVGKARKRNHFHNLFGRHAPSGINSKDCADGVCGAIYDASQHADEYAYEFGEDLRAVVDANEDRDLTGLQQITVDFEQELMKIQDPLRKQTEQAVNNFNNYGFGRATTDFYTPFNNTGGDIIFI